MDFVLEVADHFLLDNFYAKLVPASAFLAPPTVNGTVWEHSAWQKLVSHLPHPPFPFPHEVYRTYPEQFLAPASAWPRHYIPRQCLSLIITTLVGVHLLYFLFSTFSYYFVFDHEMMKHPRFLKNQVRQEIAMSLRSFPVMMLLTLPWFEGEVLGYTKMYDNVDEYGWIWFFVSIPSYACFFDFSRFSFRC
jgi:lathosterol oxidase